MKYELTENVKKAIEEFELDLEAFTKNFKQKKEALEVAKQKVEEAIKMVEEIEK